MVTETTYAGFYPSRPFWAVDKPDPEALKDAARFGPAMAEEVFRRETEDFELKISRDGRIMMRVAKLDTDQAEGPAPDFEQTVRALGEYLEYLNAFYLLLDCATVEIDNAGQFNLDEVTSRDIIRATYRDGGLASESFGSESMSSYLQMGRYLAMYSAAIPPEYDLRMLARTVVSNPCLCRAAAEFEVVVATPGLQKTCAALSKSLAEYKNGHYEISLLLAWLIIERSVVEIWRDTLAACDVVMPGGRRRIGKARRDLLLGRDFPISVVCNTLELMGRLEHPLFVDIDALRGLRNRVVHSSTATIAAGQAQLALQTASRLVSSSSGLHIVPHLTRHLP